MNMMATALIATQTAMAMETPESAGAIESPRPIWGAPGSDGGDGGEAGGGGGGEGEGGGGEGGGGGGGGDGGGERGGGGREGGREGGGGLGGGDATTQLPLSTVALGLKLDAPANVQPGTE